MHAMIIAIFHGLKLAYITQLIDIKVISDSTCVRGGHESFSNIISDCSTLIQEMQSLTIKNNPIERLNWMKKNLLCNDWIKILRSYKGVIIQLVVIDVN